MLRPTASLVRAHLGRQLIAPLATRSAARSPRGAPASLFSTHARLLEAQKQAPPKEGAKENVVDTSSFETSFASLGLSRNVKIFLIVVVSILGTMETWFWCKAAWIWWKGGEEKMAEEK